MSGFEPLEEETNVYDFYPHSEEDNDLPIILPYITFTTKRVEPTNDYPNEIGVNIVEKPDYDISKINIDKLVENKGYSVSELKVIMKELGLKTSGKKKELIAAIKIEISKRTDPS